MLVMPPKRRWARRPCGPVRLPHRPRWHRLPQPDELRLSVTTTVTVSQPGDAEPAVTTGVSVASTASVSEVALAVTTVVVVGQKQQVNAGDLANGLYRF